MIRLGLIGCATFASAVALGAVHPSVPNACLLLSAQDAATLAGFPVTRDPHDEGSGGCLYNRTGASDLSSDAVEVTVKAYANGPTAHAAFPGWVNPFPKPNPIMVYTPLSGVGDEATLIHVKPGPGIAAINFRSGAVLVKVGVFPPVSDSALSVAAKTIISRL